MTTQHTPGPWEIRYAGLYGSKGDATIVSTAPQVEGGDCTVATVYNMRPNDARLIAAAPTMLAALQHIERCASIDDSWLEPVRAAIMEATNGRR